MTPPSGTSSDAVRVLRAAQRCGMLREPMPWQVYALARLMETREDGGNRWRRAGVVVGRGNGKTAGVLAPRILDALTQGLGVLGIAQNLDVAMDTFGTVAEAVEDDPHLRRRLRKLYTGKGNARIEMVEPRTGRRGVYRLSVTAKKCRGPRAHLLAVDEAAYVPNAVRSAAQYVQNGSGLSHLQQTLAVCSAGDDVEDAAGELPWFSRWRASFLDGTDPDLLWMEYSLPDGADLTDESLWPYAVPALGHRITLDEIRDNISDPAWSREVMSRWGVVATRVIPRDRWDQLALDAATVARLDELRPTPGGLGIAVAPDEASTSLVAAYAVDGRSVVKLVDQRPGSAWAVSVAREWHQRARVPVAIDAHGPAGPLADDLRAAGVQTDVVTLDDYARACAALLRDVKEGRLGHYAQPGLDAATAARRRDVGERWVWARRAGDIDALEAATLAAIRTRHAPLPASVR